MGALRGQRPSRGCGTIRMLTIVAMHRQSGGEERGWAHVSRRVASLQLTSPHCEELVRKQMFKAAARRRSVIGDFGLTFDKALFEVARSIQRAHTKDKIRFAMDLI